MPKFTKLDANRLQITKEIVPETIISDYTYDDLVTTVANLQAQKDSFNTDIDQKIADAQANVDAADNLGIVAVPLEMAVPLKEASLN